MTSESYTQQRSRIGLTVSKDGMAASVLLRAPQEGDEPITTEAILKELEAGGVVYGIDYEAIRRATENSEYNVPVQVAVGKPPQRGENSTFTYHFDTSADHRPRETSDGHIDYRDINFIQNTDAGAILVTKTPPTSGEAGMSVRGKEISATDGRDVPFKHGANTEVSEDGLSLAASKAGVIQYRNGKVSVMDVISVSGDVDHTVGNIECRGSVRVGGDIRAGFKLDVEGDLEVNGNVEDAEVRVNGNIMVKGGFYGDGEGMMEAGGDITLKYVEGQKVRAGEDIRVGGEIINSQIEAGNRVVVEARRGKIIGGVVKAKKEIRGAVLGSEAGTLTELQVAYDAELMDRHKELVQEIERIHQDEERVKEGLYVLYRLQMEGELPPDKKKALEKLENFKKSVPQSLESLRKEKAEVEAKLQEYREAQIVCEQRLHPGVRASFGILYLDILEDYAACRIVLDDGRVCITSLDEDGA